MQPRLLGDITINRILELEAPFAQLLAFFDEALPEAVEPHRHWLEPKALDPMHGHTVGHGAVNIASKGQNAVMIGDLMHSPIQLAHPEWSPNFDFDRLLSSETRQPFLDSHCETDTLVPTAHFPSPSVGHVVSHAERAYDFDYSRA